MSEGDRSCRHSVNKLFISPQPCLPNRDELFHTNRNRTARTHTHKITEGQKNMAEFLKLKLEALQRAEENLIYHG